MSDLIAELLEQFYIEMDDSLYQAPQFADQLEKMKFAVNKLKSRVDSKPRCHIVKRQAIHFFELVFALILKGKTDITIIYEMFDSIEALLGSPISSFMVTGMDSLKAVEVLLNMIEFRFSIGSSVYGKKRAANSEIEWFSELRQNGQSEEFITVIDKLCCILDSIRDDF